MINRINNFTYKSFQNYSGPLEQFSPINIIFGYNGRGKSSLISGIENEFLKSYPEDTYRKFDRDYIKNNLLVDKSEREVKGVKVSFGKNVKLDLEIQQLRKQIQDTQGIYDKMNLNLENAKKSINEIYKRNKKNLNIKRKQIKIDNLENIQKLYSDDYNKAIKQFNNFKESNNLIELDNIDNKIKQLPEKLHIKSSISRFNLYDYKSILESEYRNSDNIPSQVVLKWMDEGMNLHQDDDHVCKFCGSYVDIKNIRMKIENYNNNKYQKIQKDVTNSLLIFDELSQLLIGWENYYKCYDVTKNCVSKENMHNLTKLIDSLINILKTKEEDISLCIDSSVFLSEFNELTKGMEQLELDINTSIENENKNLYILQNNQEVFVKGKIAEEILNNQQINDYFEEIKKCSSNIDIINQKNEEIQKEINYLEEQMNDYGLFSNLVNDVLLDLNLGFELCISNNKTDYFLKNINTDKPLEINDISEGEGNLLAFIYFYYELFSDEEQNNINPGIKMILLDDPITSLDQNNSYYLLELISNLIDKINVSNQQLFITTHVWDHYCQLLFKREKNKNIKFFEIIKEFNKSKLKLLKNLKVNPYIYSFAQVYEFQKKQESEITESEIYGIPNTIRRVLEEFLSFKTSGAVLAQKSNKKRILDLYNKSFGGEMSNTKKHKLDQMLTIINALSHNIQKNRTEVHEAAKFTITLMKDIDCTHVDYLINMVSNKC